MALVTDNSVVIGWFIPSQATAYAEADVARGYRIGAAPSYLSRQHV